VLTIVTPFVATQSVAVNPSPSSSRALKTQTPSIVSHVATAQLTGVVGGSSAKQSLSVRQVGAPSGLALASALA
jgi:hypothetical protein